MPPTAEQLAEAAVVAEDLAYLMDTWVPELAAGPLRRETSTLLRRLLVDGQYGRAWRSLDLPTQPYLSIPDLGAMLGTVDRSLLQIAFAPPCRTVRDALTTRGGEVKLHPMRPAENSMLVLIGGYFEGFGCVYGAIPLEAMRGEDPATAARRLIADHLSRSVSRAHPLGRFLTSPAALLDDTLVSREDVIKYVANKLGGAHFDHRRPGNLELLDRVGGQIEMPGEITGFTAVYAELLSIAESIAESGDAARFRDAFSRASRVA